MKLDADILAAAIGCPRERAALFSGPLDVACARYAIDTPVRMAMFIAQSTEDAREGPRAFVEKREPQFKGS